MRKGGGWAMPRGQVSIPVRPLLSWRQRLLVVARSTLAASHAAARSSVLSACWRAHSSPRHACALHGMFFLHPLQQPPGEALYGFLWGIRVPAGPAVPCADGGVSCRSGALTGGAAEVPIFEVTTGRR